MALATELRGKLMDEDEPVQKRIRLAHDVFASQLLRVERKEEVVLESLCNMLGAKSNVSTWETLLSCMSNVRMQHMHSTDIQPAVKKVLINILKTTLESTIAAEKIKNLAAQCAVIVLQDHCMEHYLSRKTKEFIELCAKLLEYLSNTEPSLSSINMATQVISVILAYYKKQPQELNFRGKFISNLLMSLIVVESKWSLHTSGNKEEAIGQYGTELFKCLQVIAIAKQHQEMYESILNYIFGHTTSTDYFTDPLLIVISKCEFNYSPQDTTNLLAKILQSFSLNYRKTPDLVVKMFIVMCYVIGLRPLTKDNKLATVNESRLQEIIGSDNILSRAEVKKNVLKTLRKMLQVMAKEEIVFDDCNFGNETGREWLARLYTYILSSFPTSFATSTIYAVCPLSSIDLLLLENLLPDIVKWSCSLSRSVIVEEAFHLLITEALKAADKQQRVHKLLGKLLDGLKIGKNNENINALIPDSFLEELKKCCIPMHSKHFANLISSLLFYLEQGCVTVLEAELHEPDDGEKQFLHIVSRLLYSVLITSRSAQHTTTAPVLEKFCAQMKTMAVLMGRLEKALCSLKESSDTLESLLQMCVGWGEVRLLLLHYMGAEACSFKDPKRPSKEENAFNVSMLHTYLSNKEWINLSKKMAKNEVCMKLMVELVGQKLRACVLLNLDDSDNMKAMAQVIVMHAQPSPLLPSLSLLIPLLDDKTRKKLTKRIAGDLLCNGPWCQVLRQPLEQSSEKFTGEIALELLIGMKQANFGCSTTVLEHLNRKNVESEDLETMATTLCEELSTCSPIHTETESELVTYLQALDMLPLKQMSKSIRCACALAVLASSANLKDSWSRPAKLLIKLLGSTGKETPFPSSMKYGQLIHWVLNSMQGDFETPMLQAAFISALLGNVISSPGSLAKGIKSIKKSLQTTPTPLVASVCNFLLPYLHNRVEKAESKNHEMFKKYEQDLALMVLKCSLKYKSDILLPALCTTFLALEDSEDLDQGLKLLPDLLSEVITKESKESIVAVLECVVALSASQREKIISQMWQYLCLAPDLPPAGYSCLQKLLETASQEQKEHVINTLLQYELEVGFGLWKLLIQMCSGDKKELQWLRKLQSSLRLSLLRWDLSDACLNNKILPTCDLLITLTKSKVELESTMLDLLLDSVIALQLDQRDIEHGLVAILKSGTSLVNCLVTSRAVLLLERIPLLQQRLALLISTIARSSTPNTPTELANQLAGCAHSIEGIGVGIYRYKKDFGRVSPYMVADVLNLFEHQNIHHAVKTHMEKYLHALLRMCDEHAEHFLLGVLPPASQQLLRSELKQCKKDKQIKV